MKAAQAKLGTLGEQCEDLRNLEQEFERFRQEIDMVRQLLRHLVDTLPPTMKYLGEAFQEMAQDLKDDTDNFYEYLSLQGGMPPSKYLIGRKEMGKELRQTIKSVQNYLATSQDPFSSTSNLRHSARSPIVVPVHDEDLAPADTVQRAAED
jgi:septation ring formation regulator EzrA